MRIPRCNAKLASGPLYRDTMSSGRLAALRSAVDAFSITSSTPTDSCDDPCTASSDYEAVVAQAPGPDDAKWVFGYGSIVFRPGFVSGQKISGCIKGWKRVMYQNSTGGKAASPCHATFLSLRHSKLFLFTVRLPVQLLQLCWHRVPAAASINRLAPLSGDPSDILLQHLWN